MDFVAVMDQVIALLRQRGRVTYRTLQIQFTLDDAQLAALKDELLYSQPHVVDDAGRGLVWTGDTGVTPAFAPSPLADPQPAQPAPGIQPSPGLTTPEAERRQLTVLFCDLVDSTVLANQLDPEDLREVVRAYQDTCARVIARYEGHIAQYLGDGLLVYFGYPLAHEDDAQRAVWAGLGMLEALGQLNTRLSSERGVQLAVRLGIHTGLVVVGDVGSDTRQEQLALGETPNLAARLQGIAAPNTLVVSTATRQLLGGFFACQALGARPVKGFAQPLEVYQVLYESIARSRLEAAGSTGLTPLVGREQEVGLLLERWAQVKEGLGQVVLLSGETGMGKSRLVQVLKEHVASEPQAWLTPCQCSPYYQNSALYPMIDLLERVVLQFDREETPQQKRSKLEGFLVQHGLPLAETVPLFASLLSLPLGTDYAPLPLSPEQHKQRTLHALLTVMLRIAAQQPLLFIMEDVHWVDPTTLEFLTLLVDQSPTTRILALWTFRPDFLPPWTGRAHLTPVTLPRLPRRQAAEMTGRVAHGKALPVEVLEQVVAKTDGVPLFVEELTKMVLESGWLQEREERYELTGPLPPLAIPTTLHDSLMARLDRLATVKSLAQLGATLGREFSYALLQAVSPWDEGTLRRGLHQLVEAEFLYQQGLPPEATYRFKHALIQETAYQSLLRSTRQQYHQRIGQVLEARFPEVVKTRPEVLAHHYSEAGLAAPAVAYWQLAGQRASERSAMIEAIRHFTRGLESLQTLPDTAERAQHELYLQTMLASTYIAVKGQGAWEAGQAYNRAHALCQQVGDTPQLIPVLQGLRRFYTARAEYQRVRELGEQLLRLAQSLHDPIASVEGHLSLGIFLWPLGELCEARSHLEQGIAHYDPQQQHATVHHGRDPGVLGRYMVALVLWALGYPSQAMQQSHDAVTRAQELSHMYSLSRALSSATLLRQFLRQRPGVQEQAEALIALATEQGFALPLAEGTILRGCALVDQGQRETGIAQMHEGIAILQAIGSVGHQQAYRVLLAEAHRHAGQEEEGLAVVVEGLAVVEKTGARNYEAELHRIQGELLLLRGIPDAPHAAACFQRALDVARRQQAKSWELRAAISLSRLWQQQGKRAEAYELLGPIYGWFTEGFDTADLQEARTLLEELG